MNSKLQTAWISALILSATTIGCQGHDPMKRESNPLKGYSVAQGPTVRYNPNQKQTPTVDPDNNQYVCFEPLKVSVKGDRGERLLEFTEDQDSTYEVTVVSLLDDGNFDVKAQGPSGIQLIRLTKKDNVAVYKLGWRPGKVKSSKGVDNFTLSLNYLSPLANKRCGSDIRVGLNLQVVKTQGVPTITFEGLPQTAINIGDQFDFSIIVDDPASLPQVAPDLQKISFPSSLANGERNVMSAVPAISCDNLGKHLEGTKFKFHCKFDSKKLDINAVKDLGTSVDTRFVASGISKRGGKSTGPVTGSITLNLPKKEVVAAEKPADQFAPPAEDLIDTKKETKKDQAPKADVVAPKADQVTPVEQNDAPVTTDEKATAEKQATDTTTTPAAKSSKDKKSKTKRTTTTKKKQTKTTTAKKQSTSSSKKGVKV